MTAEGRGHSCVLEVLLMGTSPGSLSSAGKLIAMATIGSKVTAFALRLSLYHTGIKQRAPAWKQELPGDQSA